MNSTRAGNTSLRRSASQTVAPQTLYSTRAEVTGQRPSANARKKMRPQNIGIVVAQGIVGVLIARRFSIAILVRGVKATRGKSYVLGSHCEG